MTPKARNRLVAVAALLVAGGGLAFLALGNLGANLVYYWTPGEMLSHGDQAYGPTIRLGGVVVPGTIHWDAVKTDLEFVIADSHAPGAKNVVVHAREIPPQMFRDGIGVVVEGTFSKTQRFESNRLMVNHSNEYRAPKPGEKPNLDTLQDPTAASARSP